MKYVYMAYTADETELPVGVWDTAYEIADAFGMTYSNFFKYVNLDKAYKGIKFIKVRIDDV